MANNVVQEKSFQFALDIIKLMIGGDLPNRHLIAKMGSPNPITYAEVAGFRNPA